ncbi:MAG: mandelate racemase/muconate lactonizing enzyme family protein [Pirellulaceae bacterium]
MRITSIATFRVDYPITGHFKFFAQYGNSAPARSTVVVRVVTEDGQAGWGQSVPSPRWSYETVETVQTTIERYLAPELIGLDAHDLAGIHAVMHRAIAPSFSTGQPIAKAGIDLAMHDLVGKAQRETLPQRWHRTCRDSVPLSWTINTTRDKVPVEVETALARGYRSFNIKVAPDPAVDIAICRLVRELAPDAMLWADANGGYDEPTAALVMPQLADCGIVALEQPLPANRLSGYRRLKRQGALPIILDEGVVSRVDLEEFLRLEMLDGVAMKVARCGGLYEAVRILQLVQDEGLLFFGSGLTDPDLSLAASLQLFAAFELPFPAALNAPQFLSTSILRQPCEVRAGQARVPCGAGLGVDIDAARLPVPDLA